MTSDLELPEADQSQLEALGSIPPSLERLFNRNPLSLTRLELNSIVSELRQQRQNFVAADSEAKTAGRRVNAKKAIAKGKSAVPDLSEMLKDL
jgi:hypothetical protein